MYRAKLIEMDILRDATEEHRNLGPVVKGARRTSGVLQCQDCCKALNYPKRGQRHGVID
jgi:hypothetical protein